MILYLHGFRSSPHSFKARRLAGRLALLERANDWRCPQLPVSPYEAVRLAQSIIGATPAASLTLIGSSLGGFYATWLAERHGCRAVLLNPATAPDETLDAFLGEQTLWHGGGSIVVERRHLDELRALRVPAITLPQRYYLVAATGDQVLDYRDMLRKYPGVKTTLIPGSNHGISDFDVYLDRVLAFCGVDAGMAGAADDGTDEGADTGADTRPDRGADHGPGGDADHSPGGDADHGPGGDADHGPGDGTDNGADDRRTRGA